MTRSDLIDRIAQRNSNLSADDAKWIVSAILEAISAHLVAGGRVELRNFGAFSTRVRAARTGLNPRTGEAVEVSPTRAVYFRPGKGLRARVGAESSINPIRSALTMNPLDQP